MGSLNLKAGYLIFEVESSLLSRISRRIARISGFGSVFHLLRARILRKEPLLKRDQGHEHARERKKRGRKGEERKGTLYVSRARSEVRRVRHTRRAGASGTTAGEAHSCWTAGPISAPSYIPT